MSKIFIYELRGLLFNKFFLALLAITCLYSYQILSGDIVVGIAYTAPFSQWSYGRYLSDVLPLLLITLLFFITFIFSDHEKQIKQITFATPFDPFKYCLLKCSAMTVGYFIISFFVIVISLVFYGLIFRFFGFASFVIPIILTLIPGFLFVFGLGLLAGSLHQNILYALMIVVLMIGFLPLPSFADLYGGRLFSSYPLTLPVGLDGEAAFSLPASFLLGKLFFSASGVLMMFFGIKRYINTNSN